MSHQPRDAGTLTTPDLSHDPASSDAAGTAPGPAAGSAADLASLHGAATEQVYARAGLGAAVRRGRRPAVLVVDLTRGFTEERFPTGADLTTVVEETSRLLATARARLFPVVFTTISYSPDEIASGAVTWLAKAPGLAGLVDGGAGSDIDPRLGRATGDVVIAKKGASAFFGTHLPQVLTAWGVDTLIVCGATTSGCVRASVVDALQHGYPVLIPRECCGDRAAGPHEASLFDMDAKYGDVLPLREVLDYLHHAGPVQGGGAVGTGPR